MTVPISPDHMSFVKGLIASGAFDSEAAVIDAAINLLKSQQEHEQSIQQQLRPALERLDRGEGIDLEEDQIDDFFAKIIADDRPRAEVLPAWERCEAGGGQVVDDQSLLQLKEAIRSRARAKVTAEGSSDVPKIGNTAANDV